MVSPPTKLKESENDIHHSSCCGCLCLLTCPGGISAPFFVAGVFLKNQVPTLISPNDSRGRRQKVHLGREAKCASKVAKSLGIQQVDHRGYEIYINLPILGGSNLMQISAIFLGISHYNSA